MSDIYCVKCKKKHLQMTNKLQKQRITVKQSQVIALYAILENSCLLRNKYNL